MNTLKFKSVLLTSEDVEFRIAYRQAGVGRPVVFLHGIPTSSLLWRHVQPQVAQSASTYAIDFLGYGESDKPQGIPAGLPAQVAVIGALIEEHDLRDVLVVGHDIGGGVAQLLAVALPDRISGLVLVSTIAYNSFPEPGIERLKLPEWDRRILKTDLESGFARALSKGLDATDIEIQAIAVMYAEPFKGDQGKRAYLHVARSLHTSDLSEHMDEIESLPIPILIVGGTADPFQPIANSRRLATRVRNGKLEEVEGGKHFLPEDHSRLLTNLTLAQLADSA